MLNKCMFIGNLGRDPEMKFTPSGKAVTNFSIACTEKYKDKEKTEWVNCVAWEKTAELCNQYLKKGNPVFIEGKMETRSWDDKDGNKKYKTEIIVHSVQFLGGKREASNEPRTGDFGEALPPAQPVAPGANYDLPF